MAGTATAMMTVLEALKSGEEISLDALTDKVHLERRYVINSITKLAYAGMAERAEIGVYRITQAGKDQLASGEPIKSGKKGKRTGVRRVRAGGLRQRLWNVMRQQNVGGQKKAFSLPDLLTIALNEDEETPSTYNNAGQYLRQLKKTGYLLTINRKQAGTRPGSNGFTLYKLERDTGEKSPIIRVREKKVFDPNTNEVFSW
jgi:predicted transcriptional regulator